jgi:hypothetical protein
LRAAGETETTQENIQDWLQLDEVDPRFQLLTSLRMLLKFHIYAFSKFFGLLGLAFASLFRTIPINPD